jgi:hypothetical protein
MQSWSGQVEAAWSLAKIALSNQDDSREVGGAIRVFIGLLGSEQKDVRAQAAWILGEIAGSQTAFRDEILRMGGLEQALGLLKTEASPKVQYKACFLVCNLCSHSDHGFPDACRDQVLPVLLKMLQTSQLDKVLMHTCETAANLAKGPAGNIDVSQIREEAASLSLPLGGAKRVFDFIARCSRHFYAVSAPISFWHCCSSFYLQLLMLMRLTFHINSATYLSK